MIEIKDLFCLYELPGHGTVAALRGLSLRVADGEHVVVHGPNGSGKTTLLRVLTGEVPPSAGVVRIAGRVPSAGVRREVLGLVDQHAARTLRPELTVRDNVALHLLLAGRSRREARAAAERVLDDLTLAHLGPRATATLSGGEAQRVAVGAAIAHRPRLLLADEPTGELDPEAADAVLDLLDRAARETGAALVIVSHDSQAARIADRVVRVRDGRISEEWQPGEPERVVVDDRGWLRLPEQARRRVGGSVRVSVDHDLDRPDRPERLIITGRGQQAPGGSTSRPPSPSEPSGPLAASFAGPLCVTTDLAAERSGRLLFEGLDLTWEPPTLCAIVGRSGSGKSTLLAVLSGLIDPAAGAVRIAGQDLAPLDRAARAGLRRGWIAAGLQTMSLAESLDVVDNLALARLTRGLPGAYGSAHACPDGVDGSASADSKVTDPPNLLELLDLSGVVGRPARLLSGGERQRLVIARALVSGRPLVILDEPTSQQDEAHAERVTAVLRNAADSGRVVLCATHDPILVRAADRTITIGARQPA